MGGGDKVDVVSAGLLQLQQPGGKLLRRGLPTVITGRNLAVLTKNTAQCAAGKKHSARSARSADTGLLVEMEGGPGGTQPLACAAISPTDGTVNTAEAGAKGTFHGKSSKTAKKMQQDTKKPLTQETAHATI